ncbi:hypothetical protein LCGC14_1719140 [marine sediment metagenome]|uniref:Uncharacterized protein n=1 Tax=marine sediment metagenome TaxID=412755 RepID=A0A0F9KCU2_9ZZZZ
MIPDWIKAVYRRVLTLNDSAEHIRILTNNEGKWVITDPDPPLHVVGKIPFSISLQEYIDGLQND